MNRRLLLIAGLALLGGCATAPPVAPPAPAPPPTPYGELEPLYAVSAGPGALRISVASNGCTAKADFVFYVERKGPELTVAFARKRLDDCQSFAMGRAELAFTYEELGVAPQAPLFVLNPVTAWTGPGS